MCDVTLGAPYNSEPMVLNNFLVAPGLELCSMMYSNLYVKIVGILEKFACGATCLNESTDLVKNQLYFRLEC